MYKKTTELCILNKQIVWHENCISVRLKKQTNKQKTVPSLSVTFSSLDNVPQLCKERPSGSLVKSVPWHPSVLVLQLLMSL